MLPQPKESSTFWQVAYDVSDAQAQGHDLVHDGMQILELIQFGSLHSMVDAVRVHTAA